MLTIAIVNSINSYIFIVTWYKVTVCFNAEGGSSSYGGVIPRSRSSSGQAVYMGLNGDGYQRSTSMDDGSAQVRNSCIL